jgi:hypothetical protein
MKISFNLTPLKKRIFDHFNVIVYFLILIFISGFLFFFYSQIYSTIVNPKEIDKNAIIAKKQKVNLELFNKVIDKIQQKNTPITAESKQNKDPFVSI